MQRYDNEHILQIAVPGVETFTSQELTCKFVKNSFIHIRNEAEEGFEKVAFAC